MSCVAVKIIIDKGPAPDLFSQLQDVEFNERKKKFSSKFNAMQNCSR